MIKDERKKGEAYKPENNPTCEAWGVAPPVMWVCFAGKDFKLLGVKII